MYLIGLTGGIGTGKSTISKYLASKNIPIIDSDQIARDVVQPGTKCWKLIREKFGSEVIDSKDGQINRQYLGQLIFQDPAKRKLLESITHPEIKKRNFLKILYYLLTFHSFVVLDIPLLFETKAYIPYLSYIIVVKCDHDEQLKRIKQRNGYSDKEALSRMKAQIPLEEKCRMADFVIDNNGSIKETLNQVDQLFANQLKPPRFFYIIRLILIMFYMIIVFCLLITLYKLLC